MEVTNILSLMIIIVNISLVVITWMYVRQVKLSVKVMDEHVKVTRDILKASHTPKLTMYLTLDNNVFQSQTMKKTFWIVLRVENIGTGYATDVKFTGDLSFKCKKDAKELGELYPFKNGVQHFSAGYKIDTHLYVFGTLSKEIDSNFKITVSYKDPTGDELSDTFPFDLRDWANVADQFGGLEKAT